jgi:hypothetical protein
MKISNAFVNFHYMAYMDSEPSVNRVMVQMKDHEGRDYAGVCDGGSAIDHGLSNMECQARCLEEIVRQLRRVDSICKWCNGTGRKQ